MRTHEIFSKQHSSTVPHGTIICTRMGLAYNLKEYILNARKCSENKMVEHMHIFRMLVYLLLSLFAAMSVLFIVDNEPVSFALAGLIYLWPVSLLIGD